MRQLVNPTCLRMAAVIGLLAGGITAFASGAIKVTPDIVYGHKLGMALTMDMYKPSEPNGAAVLFMNSGGFVSGVFCQYQVTATGIEFVPAEKLILTPYHFHYPPMEQWSFQGLLDAGFTVFDIRHGSSPKFTLDEIVEDVRRGVRFVKYHAEEYGIDPDRLGLSGASAGGYLALYLAISANEGGVHIQSQIAETGDAVDQMPSEVKAVATWYPAGYDFIATKKQDPEAYQYLTALHVDSLLLDSLSIKHYISPGDPPIYTVVGNQDFPFIMETCRAVHDAYQNLGLDSKLTVLEGSGHEFRDKDNNYIAVHGKQAMTEIVEWFKTHLK